MDNFVDLIWAKNWNFFAKVKRIKLCNIMWVLVHIVWSAMFCITRFGVRFEFFRILHIFSSLIYIKANQKH